MRGITTGLSLRMRSKMRLRGALAKEALVFNCLPAFKTFRRDGQLALRAGLEQEANQEVIKKDWSCNTGKVLHS